MLDLHCITVATKSIYVALNLQQLMQWQQAAHVALACY